MSYTTVKAVWPGKKSEPLVEYQNSHGSAPVIWNQMAMRYLRLDDNAYRSQTDKLWPIYKRGDMPAHHRAVLVMTYDNAMVLKADYERAAADIRAYLVDFPVQGGYVNHWQRIAELFESQPDCPAIGFWMTSVSDDPFLGDWDEELDDYGQPDWDQFWSAYELADYWAGLAEDWVRLVAE